MEEIVFGTETLVEGLEPFAGRIDFAQFNCKCEDCRKGTASLVEKGVKVPDRTRIHIRITPDKDAPYDGKQNIWATVSRAKSSVWGILNQKFEEMGVVEELQENGIKWLEGKRFYFESVKYTPGFGNTEKQGWFPVELLEE